MKDTIAVGVENPAALTNLVDENDNAVAKYSSEKQYVIVSFSSDLIEEGKTYTALAAGEEIGSATVSDHTSTINVQTSNFPGNNGKFGGPGGSFENGGPQKNGQRGI